MPYRLNQGESVEKGIRRIIAEQTESAIAHLRNEDESLRDQGIHEARKSIKKLRAIVRLLMPGLGAAGIRDNHALRDTGRALSNLRDAAALIETVESLSERHFANPAMEQLAVVRSSLRRRLEDTVRGEDCRTVIGGAVASLKSFKKRSAQWQIAGGGFAAIAPGLEGTYRRCRKRLKMAQATPTPENIHVLRKRIKDHWYQVRLLDGTWRVILNGSHASRDKELRELQDRLGDHHNLTVLRDAIAAAPPAFGGKKIIPAVLDLIASSQKELREQSFASATKILTAKPKAHMQETAASWEMWQNGKGVTAKPVASAAGAGAKQSRSQGGSAA